MKPGSWVVLAVALALVGAASPARAQERSAEARSRFREGLALYDRGDIEGALAAFLEAHRLEPRPAALFNIGLLHAALRDPARAVDSLEEVLARPGTLSAARVAKARAVLDEQAAKLGFIRVVVPVPGAVIEVNNRPVATSPVSEPLRVAAGQVLVAAVAPRHTPSRQLVEVTAGAAREVSLPLTPVERPLAQLKVVSATPGARVLVNGEVVGETPLLSTVPILPGKVTVALTRAGFRSAQQELTVGEGAAAEVALELEEDRAETSRGGARLVVEASQTQVVTQVNGKSRGVYQGPLLLPPGPHRLTFERGGFLPIVRTVNLLPESSQTLKLDFEPTAELRASLEEDGRLKRTLGVVGMAVGGALLVGASVYTGVIVSTGDAALAEAQRIDEDRRTNRTSPCVTMEAVAQCGPRIEALTATHSASLGLRWLGVSLAATGAVLAGLGVASFVLAPDVSRFDPRPGSGDLSEELSVRLDVSPTGVALSGRF